MVDREHDRVQNRVTTEASWTLRKIAPFHSDCHASQELRHEKMEE